MSLNLDQFERKNSIEGLPTKKTHWRNKSKV